MFSLTYFFRLISHTWRPAQLKKIFGYFLYHVIAWVTAHARVTAPLFPRSQLSMEKWAKIEVLFWCQFAGWLADRLTNKYRKGIPGTCWQQSYPQYWHLNHCHQAKGVVSTRVNGQRDPGHWPPCPGSMATMTQVNGHHDPGQRPLWPGSMATVTRVHGHCDPGQWPP